MKQTKPILYIDVDGVLLVHGGTLSKDGRPQLRPYSKEFLEYATEHFECRWLTGWHYNYEWSRIEELYEVYLKPAGIDRRTFSKIVPHDWSFISDLLLDKLNSFSLDEDSYVIDDLLWQHRVPPTFRHRFIKIHPTRPNELKRIVKILKRIVDAKGFNAQ